MIDATNFVKTLKGKPVAVFGIGVSNRAVISALLKAGAVIAAWDDDPARLQDICVATRDLMQEDLSAYACLVLSPGIKPDHPVVTRAHAAGTEILCDIEILHRCRHGRRTVGITGTNGKSTTTALIGHILNASGVPAVTGGNIGYAALALDLPPPGGVIVLELSSYQLELCPTFAPDIAVLLNISPDHLDHHGTMDDYIAAKARILRGDGVAVITGDDDASRALRQKSEKHVIETPDIKFSNPALAGAHNRQNALAATAVCRQLGLNDQQIIAALNSFPGLAHRQFPVRTLNGVAYINDSKATNADAAAKALAAFTSIHWIVGGKPKAGGLNGLESYMDHVRQAYVIGAAAAEFGDWLGRQHVVHQFCGTLDKAVLAAHAAARPGETVLLSPACASYDQFKNFEERGEQFVALVNSLSLQGEGRGEGLHGHQAPHPNPLPEGRGDSKKGNKA